MSEQICSLEHTYYRALNVEFHRASCLTPLEPDCLTHTDIFYLLRAMKTFRMILPFTQDIPLDRRNS